MATGFLPVTFRFSRLSLFSFFTFVICVLGFWTTEKVYAIKWFSVYGSGVLSGDQIINDGIPDSPPTGFDSDVVQHPNPGNITTYGSLISSGDQDIQNFDGSTDDAYVKNIALVPSSPSIEKALNSTDVINLPKVGVGAIPCVKIFDGGLNPASVYKSTNSGCTTSAINALSGKYSLSGNGLAVILISKDDVSSLSIPKDMTSVSVNQRILILTDADVTVTGAVGADPAILDIDGPPNVELAVVTTSIESAGFKVDQTSSTNSAVLEGPIVANSNVTLGRDITGTYPGVYVINNPFYICELSIMAPILPPLQGLFESKTTWRYD